MKKLKYLVFLTPVFLLACTSMPPGPNVMVLPGTGKTMATFQADDQACRQFAISHPGTNANDAQLSTGVKTAALGTALGAATGAAVNGGKGAIVGAGVGATMGSLVGAGTGTQTAYTAQMRYDNAYLQCMYAKGHRIPVTTSFSETQATTPSSQPEKQPSATQYGPPPNTTKAPDPQYIVK